MIRKIVLGMALVTVVSVSMLMVATAHGEIIDLRTLVSSNTSLIHQWTFEGATDNLKKEDKKGSEDLELVGVGTAPSFITGWDSTTKSSQFFGGAAFRSPIAGFVHPEEGTVEFLYRPDNTDGDKQYIGTCAAGSNRLYYGTTFGPTPYENGLAFGNAAWGSATRRYLTGTTTPDMEVGHWYYVAVVRSRSGATINADVYLADLTEGQTQLTHTLQNASFAAYDTNFGAERLGIGSAYGGGQYFTGVMDEVAYYNSELTSTVLQDHLDAIHVPEPSAFVLLLGLGIGGLFWVLRHKRRN